MTILDGIWFRQSPFYSAGRGGNAVDSIVLHWMDGTLASTDTEFASGGRKVSAHFGIEDSNIHGYVHTSDTAWHAGNWPENQRSIGIEHSAGPGRNASALTIQTSIEVQVQLCRQYGIDPSHIYPHNMFFATDCPGTLPLAAMNAAVR